MGPLLWIIIGFIAIGFVLITTMKKGMESKVTSIKVNPEDEENSLKAKSVIWWIWSTTAWGIVSIFVVVWYFHNHFG